MVSQGYVEITVRAPVEFVNLPEDVQVEGLPSWVEVRLEGAPWVVKKLGPGDVKVLVVHSDFSQKEAVLPLDNVKVPEGIRVLAVKPERVRVRFVKLYKKQVPVIAAWKRDPDFKWRVEPLYVTLVGLKNKVQRVKYLKTVPLDPKALKKSKAVEVYVSVPDGIKVVPMKVKVEVSE